MGSGDTIGMRSSLYFVSLAISLIAAVTAVLIGRRLADRLGGWHAALVSIAGYIVVMLIVTALDFVFGQGSILLFTNKVEQ